MLTAGGDCQGLNAALRAVALTAFQEGWKVTGIHDGFLGLAEGCIKPLEKADVSPIIGLGGTILGTGRGGGRAKGTEEAVENCVKSFNDLGLDALVCLGGDGTQRFSYELVKKGVPIVTLPKTIDNDIAQTDITFGYDTAVQVSVMALDRLRTTADSHHRLMILEVMGRDAGWLAAGAALAGGADICLVPEIPYSTTAIVKSLKAQIYEHKAALLVVAEGAISQEDALLGLKPKKHVAAMRLVDQIPELTGIEARLTTLGYVSRGGTPTAGDRIFATQCGSKAIEYLKAGITGVMVASQGGALVPVPLEKVAGRPRLLPRDHSMVKTLQSIGVCMGI
ncbi:6-phosphofructokinase [Wohlfahrtiimonas chitiniclastica]|nr:6-phosphofructokinase [Wohlfahrtiimonas chitiniclastica]